MHIFIYIYGHSEKDYIRSTVKRILTSLGWRVCVLNWRGFNSILKSTRVSCPADISDMERVFDHVAGSSVCCSALQRVAGCCRVLQCVAECV